jgi:hypothetical protein
VPDVDTNSFAAGAAAVTAIPGTRLRSGTAPPEPPDASQSTDTTPANVAPTRILSHLARFARPAVLVDPRPEWLAAVRSLRAHGAPLVLLSARRLEPAMYARGVRRRRLPSLQNCPQCWEALLLELAARLEPRPLLFACSPIALEFLHHSCRTLEPHYDYANLQRVQAPGTDGGLGSPEIALRRAVLRGEAALEVQMTRDANGRRTGLCVLAWAPGAAPDVLVSSVVGTEVAARTEAWLQASHYVGYARALWAPDRFGRLELQAASALPGAGLELALQDGVDFPELMYAAAADSAVRIQHAHLRLARKLPIVEPGLEGEASNLVELGTRPSHRDPLPWMAALLRGLVRS